MPATCSGCEKKSHILSIIAILVHIASKLLLVAWQRIRREETDDGDCEG